jgi:hypothetical protein
MQTGEGCIRNFLNLKKDDSSVRINQNLPKFRLMGLLNLCKY